MIARRTTAAISGGLARKARNRDLGHRPAPPPRDSSPRPPTRSPTTAPFLAAIAGAVAFVVPDAARASGEIYRCEPRDAFTVERGGQVRGSAVAALRAAVEPLVVDTGTGAVRFGGTQLHQWSIQQPGNASSDFVAEGRSAADGLWIRVWETPASFVLVQNSTNIITGVCVVAE